MGTLVANLLLDFGGEKVGKYRFEELFAKLSCLLYNMIWCTSLKAAIYLLHVHQSIWRC